MTRAVVTNSVIARANMRFAERLVSLAGTGISQQGPMTRAAIAGAAIWMASAVGILSSWAIRRAVISSALATRYPRGTYRVGLGDWRAGQHDRSYAVRI